MRQFGVCTLHMKFKTLWYYSRQILVFEFSYLPSSLWAVNQERLKPKPSYKALFLLHFFLSLSKTDLLSIKLAQLHLFKSAELIKIEI